MALGKILNLKGVNNKPPKTDQSLGGFRVARNVMPTPDDLLVPRFDNAEVTPTVPSQTTAILQIAKYDSSVLEVISRRVDFDTTVVGLLKNNLVVPQTSDLMVPTAYSFPDDDRDAFNTTQTYRINNTVYVLVANRLLKYDGVELGFAGCLQPSFDVLNADVTGTRFVRVVQHTIDFDSNEPVSEYIQFTTGASGTTELNLSNSSPAGYTSMPNTSTAGVIPSEVPLFSLAQNTSYFIASACSYSSGIFTPTVTETNIEIPQIGSYVFVSGNRTDAVSAAFATAASIDSYGIALKVASVSPLTLSAQGKYLNTSREWVDYDFSSIGASIAAALRYGTKYFLSFWESTSSTGIYYYRAQVPAFPVATINSLYSLTTTGAATATAGSATSLFTYGPILNDWYDVNSRKVDFNSDFNWGGGFKGFAKYQGQLVLYNENYLWLSDTTAGGWVEQGNMGLSALIGDREYGEITSACGTNDFLLEAEK